MANVLTPKFRVSFPNVFKARFNEMKGKEEFGVMAIFPKGADLSKLVKAAEEAMVDSWGADKKKWPATIRSPFRKCEEKVTEDEATGKKIYPMGMEEGGIFMNFNSKNKPGLVNASNEDIINEADFYAGCYARATVGAYAYGGPGTKFQAGVAFGLNNIQKMGEGDPLGSRTRAQDDFAPIENADSAGGAADLFR